MKRLILIIFVIIAQNCLGQQPSFDKVILSYAKGHNSWGDTGVYSKQELFEISPVKSGGYRFSKYLKIKYTASPVKYRKDTIRLKTRELRKISKSKIDSLFNALQVTKDNFTLSFIKPRLETPSKNEILKLALKIDSEFKAEDEDVADLNENISKIQNFDKLESYIKLNKPDTALSTVTMDAWDDMKIVFIRKKDSTVFQMDLLQRLGQPILKQRINPKYFGRQNANLEANILLEEILPTSSQSKRRVGINSLTEDYLRWYIDKML